MNGWEVWGLKWLGVENEWMGVGPGVETAGWVLRTNRLGFWESKQLARC